MCFFLSPVEFGVQFLVWGQLCLFLASGNRRL